MPKNNYYHSTFSNASLNVFTGWVIKLIEKRKIWFWRKFVSWIYFFRDVYELWPGHVTEWTYELQSELWFIISPRKYLMYLEICRILPTSYFQTLLFCFVISQRIETRLSTLDFLSSYTFCGRDSYMNT